MRRFSSTLSEGKSFAAFGHHGNALLDNIRRMGGADPVVLECDRVRPVGQDTGDGAHQGGLAGPVCADDRHRLAFLEPDIDPEQRLEIAVVGGQIVLS